MITFRSSHPGPSRLELGLRISDDPSAPYAVDAALRMFRVGVLHGDVPDCPQRPGASVAARTVVASGARTISTTSDSCPRSYDEWTGTVPGAYSNPGTGVHPGSSPGGSFLGLIQAPPREPAMTKRLVRRW